MTFNEKASVKNGVQFGWDATSLELAQTCLRKYYYTMVRGIKPRGESVHLLFGGIYASSLELFYHRLALGDDRETALRTCIRHALSKSWDSEAGVPRYFNDTKKTRVNLIRTLVWYVDEFANSDAEVLQTHHLKNGKPAVELSFAFELSEDVVYCGHLDRVVDWGGSLYVMDQKTTGGTIGPYYFDQFKPNNQMSGYTLAGKIILETPISGVIIDAAQIAVNFSRFERGFTTRSRDELDEWTENTLDTIQRARAATMLDYWPMNLSACGNYGGCPFRPICRSSPKVRENVIKSDYEVHEWDPLKAR